MQQVALKIGQNTLPILLFSPLFTFLAKLYQPWLTAIDGTGTLFLISTLSITCAVSIGIWRLIIRGISHRKFIYLFFYFFICMSSCMCVVPIQR